MLHLPSQEDIQKGQSIYSKNNLPFYDLFVIQFSNYFAWHCPRKKLIAFFKDNVSHNHLDIGVGTGYFLNKLDASPDEQRIGLLDLNEHCLAYAKKKLARFNPEVYRQDVFAPFSDITQKFDSVSLNYLIHCLPGSLPQKAVIFDHVKSVLNPNGVVFGTTILGQGINKNWLAKKMMSFYNSKKIHCNINDDITILQNELEMRFSFVQIKTIGCVALFVAR